MQHLLQLTTVAVVWAVKCGMLAAYVCHMAQWTTPALRLHTRSVDSRIQHVQMLCLLGTGRGCLAHLPHGVWFGADGVDAIAFWVA